MEGETGTEIMVKTLEEIKEVIRSCDGEFIIHVEFGKEDGDGGRVQP
ncbi:MAG: hypothetical protein K2I96_18355 [Lachnospiraceae bacterium]|nr:hypothetical protein [Lachnospiraceae bacterium]